MAVDNDAIVAAVSGLGLAGNEEGLIPAFGLYLTFHYADYYNRISFETLHAAKARGEKAFVDAHAALIEAGHVCAFNTFGGVMVSQEWDAVVGPMLERREDWVHGIVGVINTMGWGAWKVDALEPDARLRISIANSYESKGYLGMYGRSRVGPTCLLATGGVAGIMNLLYHGDITKRPALTGEYYEKLFHGGGQFRAREIECRALGADRCVFEATRASARWS